MPNEQININEASATAKNTDADRLGKTAKKSYTTQTWGNVPLWYGRREKYARGY